MMDDGWWWSCLEVPGDRVKFVEVDGCEQEGKCGCK